MGKNEYRLIIDINGNGGGAISQEKQTTSEDSKREATLRSLVKYQVVRPFLESTKQIILNDVNTYYGSEEISQRIQFAMDSARTLNSTAQQGLVLSAVFGLTKVAGFGISLAITAGQKLLDIAVKQNEINNKMRIENQQLNILRGRAGAQFNRSRVGE